MINSQIHFFAFILIFGVVTRISGDVICGPGDSYLPSPADCSSFYQCVHGLPIPMSCPPTHEWDPPLVFNPVRNECVWADEFECSISTTTTEIGKPTDTEEPPIITEEPSTTTTELTTSLTQPSTIYTTTESSTVICGPDDTYLPSPVDCSSFYQCVYGVPVPMSCPPTHEWDPPLVFNPITNECVWADEFECSISTTTTEIGPPTDTEEPPIITEEPSTTTTELTTSVTQPSTVICGPDDTYLPSPVDCSLFYQCVHGVPQPMSCPPIHEGGPSLVFNPITNECVWADEYECLIYTTPSYEGPLTTDTEKPEPSSTTTEPTTTTTEPTTTKIEPTTTSTTTEPTTTEPTTTEPITTEPITTEPTTTEPTTTEPTTTEPTTTEPITTEPTTTEPITTEPITTEPTTTEPTTTEPTTTEPTTTEPITTEPTTTEPITTEPITTEPTTTEPTTTEPTTTEPTTTEPTTTEPTTTEPITTEPTTTTTEHPPVVCGIEDTLLPNPVDCNSFYECTAGIPMLQFCAIGEDSLLVFNPISKECVPSCEYNCQIFNLCHVYDNPNTCLLSPYECAFCYDTCFTNECNFDIPRCDTYENLVKSGCQSFTMDESEYHSIVEANHNCTTWLPVEPGRKRNITVTFSLEKHPLDLYYLMDFSYSMSDDQANLMLLSSGLVDTLTNLTNDLHLGFGTFVDKPRRPFGADTDYSFHNDLPLTSETDDFVNKIAAIQILDGRDTPESHADALSQVIECDQEIGWRQNARQVVLLATDAVFHIAGDGILGGIIDPYVDGCYLDSRGSYYQELAMDYPSIDQLANAASKNQDTTTVIFATSTEAIDFYEYVASKFKSAYVGILETDSSNVLDLIKDEFAKIDSRMEIEKSETRDTVRFRFFSSCMGSGGALETMICENLASSGEITFIIEIDLSECPNDKSDTGMTLTFNPVGLPVSIPLRLSFLCPP